MASRRFWIAALAGGMLAGTLDLDRVVEALASTVVREVPVAGAAIYLDCERGLQLAGRAGDRSGGNRRLAPLLARAAVAAGADLVFMEVHENPDAALSDGPNSLPLEALPRLFAALKQLREITLASWPGSEFPT